MKRETILTLYGDTFRTHVTITQDAAKVGIVKIGNGFNNPAELVFYPSRDELVALGPVYLDAAYAMEKDA